MDQTRQIAVASDHAGYPLKAEICRLLETDGYSVLNLGTDSAETSVDYPDYGHLAAAAVTEGRAWRAVIVCGTGVGISIAANRIPGVRAALCHDVTTARLARLHNNANILSLGARITGTEVALDCVRAFLETEFESGRHQRRIDKL